MMRMRATSPGATPGTNTTPRSVARDAEDAVSQGIDGDRELVHR